MSDAALPALPAEVLRDASESLNWLIEDMAEELDAEPTLEEVLDVLGWGVPEDGEDLAEPYAPPVRFTALLGDGRAYRPGRPAQTQELNDAAFSEAAELLSAVALAGAEAAGAPFTLNGLAQALAQVLRALGPEAGLGDVTAEELRQLSLTAANDAEVA